MRTDHGPDPRFPINPGDWFSPRRRLYVQRLLDYLCWNGARRCWLPLDTFRYSELHDNERMHRYAVDRAVDDAYTLGLIDMRLRGDVPALLVLCDDADGAPVNLPPLPSEHAPQPKQAARRRNSDRMEGSRVR